MNFAVRRNVVIKRAHCICNPYWQNVSEVKTIVVSN